MPKKSLFMFAIILFLLVLVKSSQAITVTWDDTFQNLSTKNYVNTSLYNVSGALTETIWKAFLLNSTSYKISCGSNCMTHEDVNFSIILTNSSINLINISYGQVGIPANWQYTNIQIWIWNNSANQWRIYHNETAGYGWYFKNFSLYIPSEFRNGDTINLSLIVNHIDTQLGMSQSSTISCNTSDPYPLSTMGILCYFGLYEGICQDGGSCMSLFPLAPEPAPYVDTTPPVITIQSPLNTTYIASSIWANATLNEAGSWCGRSLDGDTNTSLSNTSLYNWNNLMTVLSNGNHNVRFYCNDTSGNMGSSALRYFNLCPPNYTLVYQNKTCFNQTHYIWNYTWYDACPNAYIHNSSFELTGDCYFPIPNISIVQKGMMPENVSFNSGACVLANNGNIYCFGNQKVYQYNPTTNNASIVKTITDSGFFAKSCAVKPHTNIIYCVGGTYTWSGSLFVYDADTNNGTKYESQYNLVIQCGLAFESFFGDTSCFVNDQFFANLGGAFTYPWDTGMTCIGGYGTYLDFDGTHDNDECFILVTPWTIIPDPWYPNKYLSNIPVSGIPTPYVYQRGADCVTYKANYTVCLGHYNGYPKYLTYTDKKLINGSLPINVTISPLNMVYWTCASPNEASLHSGSYDDTIICLGAMNLSTYTYSNKIWYYYPDTDQFGEVPATLPPYNGRYSCVPAFNGKIYCFGGGNGKILELTIIQPVGCPACQNTGGMTGGIFYLACYAWEALFVCNNFFSIITVFITAIAILVGTIAIIRAIGKAIENAKPKNPFR